MGRTGFVKSKFENQFKFEASNDFAVVIAPKNTTNLELHACVFQIEWLFKTHRAQV